jgi:hypothetical protein
MVVDGRLIRKVGRPSRRLAVESSQVKDEVSSLRWSASRRSRRRLVPVQSSQVKSSQVTLVCQSTEPSALGLEVTWRSWSWRARRGGAPKRMQSMWVEYDPAPAGGGEERVTFHVMSCSCSCHVMSCHVMSCHVMSCHVVSCQAKSGAPSKRPPPSSFALMIGLTCEMDVRIFLWISTCVRGPREGSRAARTAMAGRHLASRTVHSAIRGG